jgi:hypothetical protein
MCAVVCVCVLCLDKAGMKLDGRYEMVDIFLLQSGLIFAFDFCNSIATGVKGTLKR